LVKPGRSKYVRESPSHKRVRFEVHFSHSLCLVGVLPSAIRETNVPNFIACEVVHLERDVSGKLKMKVASFIVENSVCHDLVLKRVV
jgi:hypothetical protein